MLPYGANRRVWNDDAGHRRPGERRPPRGPLLRRHECPGGVRPATGAECYRPVPVSVTDCGLAGSTSLIVSAALLVPIAVGLNVTLIVQLDLAATLVPQVFV